MSSGQVGGESSRFGGLCEEEEEEGSAGEGFEF